MACNRSLTGPTSSESSPKRSCPCTASQPAAPRKARFRKNQSRILTESGKRIPRAGGTLVGLGIGVDEHVARRADGPDKVRSFRVVPQLLVQRGNMDVD